MGFEWTKSQSAAINTRGRNILVSAAAGSGKTAVLSERIVKRVMHDRDRTDIDRMLVVTFTNAAAAEMRERIGSKLREYKEEPHHLKIRCRGRAAYRVFKSRAGEIRRRKHDMLLALDDASICTIDSFCNSCVKSFTHELNISPDFRLCDPAEDAIITDGAADTLFDRLYTENNESFRELTEYYSTMRGDGELKRLILMIYGFLHSYAEPMEKLDELLRHYEDGGDIFSSEWAAEIMLAQKAAASRLKNRFEAEKREIEKICCCTAHEEMIENVLDPCIDALSGLCAVDENGGEAAWDAIYNITLAFVKYPPAKPAVPRKKDADKTGYAEMKERYEELFKRQDLGYVVQNAAEVREQHAAVCVQAAKLKWLLHELDSEVKAVKRRRSVYSFSDIEHMTYRLITYPEYEEIAELYRERYTDVLIDEYQDTNGLQDAIFKGISNGKNLFMVGDLKQSIYAFRGGDPSIFKKKGAEYTPYDKRDKNGSEPVRIDLSDNYRSSAGVVDAVNELFGYVMTDELGDVDYDREGERLRCGRNKTDSEAVKACGGKSELVYIPVSTKELGTENGEAVGRESIEARYIAQRIREMVDSHAQVFDGKEVRDIRYGDFTIIANSIKPLVNIYSEALGAKGIPLGIPSLGYYDFYEVSVMLSFLRVITNRRRDVPLAALMRSPIGGFNDEELAEIALAVKGDDLYGRLLSAVRISRAKLKRGERDLPIDRSLMEKTERLLALIDRFDSYKHYRSAAAIVYAMYTETGFYDFVGALDGGRMAQQNLTRLYEKAKKFDTALSGGLYAFVKYIERLRADSDREEGAASSAGVKDAVKMMTIHGSKGLEFPVVFMVSCGKRFRRVDTETGMINREAGIALRYLDTDKKISIDTPLCRWLRLRTLRENRSEDMRKLYVGLTRARERLICLMSGRSSAADMQAEAEKTASALTEARSAGRKHLIELVEAPGFYGWLLSAHAAAVAEKGGSAWLFDNDIDVKKYLSGDVYSIIRHRYRFGHLTSLPSKTTVSKVKEEQKRNGGETFEPMYGTDLVPLDADERSDIPANILGTAYHKVMELSDPLRSKTADGVKEQIQELCVAGYLSRQTADAIEPQLIAAFYDSEMGERVTEAYKAGRLHRETPFEMAITPDEYEKGIGESTDGDEVLVQGTIDCWFEDENGRRTVIDYKTDSYRGADTDEARAEFADAKAEEYRVQLKLYADALRLTDKGKAEKAEKYLYLFRVNCFKRVEEDEE